MDLRTLEKHDRNPDRVEQTAVLRVVQGDRHQQTSTVGKEEGPLCLISLGRDRGA